MPVHRNPHRRRALFEEETADRSATNMARIHQRLSILHPDEPDARPVETSLKGRALTATTHPAPDGARPRRATVTPRTPARRSYRRA